MSRTRYRIYNENQPHFLTSTIVEWIPLFTDREIVSLVLESLRFLQKERSVELYAYVIMQDHLHLIASAPQLSTTMKEFKSFTARTIIDYLEAKGLITLLERLRRSKLQHKTLSEYQLWQEGNHPQEIYGEKMLIQKIEYIHHNPVRRGYVDEPRGWRYSSAQNYEGMKGLLEIRTDWRNEK